jgi:hypothetical protein
MNAEGEVREFRRRNWTEAAQLAGEFEQSGLRRKEFCAVRGLSMHTLDAWRRRAARPVGVEKIVPVELVESCEAGCERMLAGLERSRPLRVVLPSGLRIEAEPDFDGAESRRLIVALEAAPLPRPMARAIEARNRFGRGDAHLCGNRGDRYAQELRWTLRPCSRASGVRSDEWPSLSFC